MHFVSFYFLLFLLVLLPLHYLLPAKLRLPLLLIASYLFYATWSIPFIGVILVSTTGDYWMAKFIETHERHHVKRLAMTAGLTLNLLMFGQPFWLLPYKSILTLWGIPILPVVSPCYLTLSYP